MTQINTKYFDDETGNELYKPEFGLSAFKRLRHCDLSDWSEDHKLFLSGMMKMAFNDGIDVGKAEVKENLDGIYKAIDIFLENGNQD